ncbi:MAG TPA: PspC domain-containing protein [Roseiflexaceae bacterium]
MQPRLMRSRTEVIIAGVCGGLAEYFGLDPVIVRLIFVLVTLTTGIGFIVYPVLWLVMPKAGAFGSSAPRLPQDADAWRHRMNEFGQEVAQAGQQISKEMRQVFLREQAQQSQAPTVGEEPPPAAYNFDPMTGQPTQTATPTTGQTINLRVDPTLAENYVPTVEANSAPQQPVYYGPPAPAARPKRGRSMGIVLVAIGALVLAGQFDIAQYVFPLLMIGAGLMLLRRH